MSTEHFLYILLLQVIGACGVFFIKGVLEIRAKEFFNSVDFVRENQHRLIWLAFGLIVSALGAYFDPASLQVVWEYYLPLPVQIAAPLLIGAGISALTLMVPRSSDTK